LFTHREGFNREVKEVEKVKEVLSISNLYLFEAVPKPQFWDSFK
jgi:hypothetical protein